MTGGTAGGVKIDPNSPTYPYEFGYNATQKYTQTAGFSFNSVSFGEGTELKQESIRFVVNNARTPREFTAVTAGRNGGDTGRMIAYIYEVAGDTLRLAYYDDPFCTDRPHGFEGKEQPPGSPPLVVLEFKLYERPQPRRPRVAVPGAGGFPGAGGGPGGSTGAPGGVIRRPGAAGGQPTAPPAEPKKP